MAANQFDYHLGCEFCERIHALITQHIASPFGFWVALCTSCHTSREGHENNHPHAQARTSCPGFSLVVDDAFED